MVFFICGNFSPSYFKTVELIGNNYLRLGNYILKRKFPVSTADPNADQYYKFLTAQTPYMDQWNNNTLYFRIPSFESSAKTAIDSILNVWKDRILKTENLIIDIRNGTGGSDASYQGILPFVYTNPIRTVGVEYLSTKLNNQRMLDFIQKARIWF